MEMTIKARKKLKEEGKYDANISV